MIASQLYVLRTLENHLNFVAETQAFMSALPQTAWTSNVQVPARAGGPRGLLGTNITGTAQAGMARPAASSARRRIRPSRARTQSAAR